VLLRPRLRPHPRPSDFAALWPYVTGPVLGYSGPLRRPHPIPAPPRRPVLPLRWPCAQRCTQGKLDNGRTTPWERREARQS